MDMKPLAHRPCPEVSSIHTGHPPSLLHLEERNESAATGARGQLLQFAAASARIQICKEFQKWPRLGVEPRGLEP
jgi:hypothetical protein